MGEESGDRGCALVGVSGCVQLRGDVLVLDCMPSLYTKHLL